MKWIEAKVCYESNDNEKAKQLIVEAFNDLGVFELSFLEPIKRSALDFYKNERDLFTGVLSVSGYFPENRYIDLKKKEFMKLLNSKLEIEETIVEVFFLETDEDEWKDNWKKYFKTTKITDKIVIKPTWDSYKAEDDEIVINIDPGRAFGTGAHETTDLCIKMLEKYLGSEEKVVDIGIGSGILSIASILLGASEVRGTDIDEEAVNVAVENMDLNKIEKASYKFYASESTKDIPDKWGDVIVSNIIADILVGLIPQASKKLKSGGVFIASGILKEKYKLVKEILIKNNFEIIDELSLNEWVSIVGRKK